MLGRTLVTGAAGFSGRWLLERLGGHAGCELFGTDVAARGPDGLAGYLAADLADAAAADRVVSVVRPQTVFHLAGRWTGDETELRRTNVEGLLNLLAALRRCGAAPVRMVVVGSAAELGSEGCRRLPADEDAPCRPESPYGRSKHAATLAALAANGEGLEVVVARTFNLVGPGMPRGQALGSFAAQIAEVLADRAAAVRCGPLGHRRDFVDVRDAVAAYIALAERGRGGQVYNVASGRSHSMRGLLERLIALAGRPIAVEATGSLPRPGDVADVCGDVRKIARETGWGPQIALEASLKDLLASNGVS